MFSGRHAVKKMDDGAVFIDRDPEIFRYLLNYLRNSRMHPKLKGADNITSSLFDQELDFWCIPKLNDIQ